MVGRLVQPGDEDMVHRYAYRNVYWKWSSSEVTGSKSHEIIVMEESCMIRQRKPI